MELAETAKDDLLDAKTGKVDTRIQRNYRLHCVQEGRLRAEVWKIVAMHFRAHLTIVEQ